MNSNNADAVTRCLIVAATTQSASYLRRAGNSVSLLMGIAVAALSGAALAQSATVTPTQGQSPQQVESDEQQCYASAVQSSGYDPATSQPAVGGRARPRCAVGNTTPTTGSTTTSSGNTVATMPHQPPPQVL